MSVSTGPETGFAASLMNAGESRNTGLEVLLTFVPIRKSTLEWSAHINFARNRNKIVALYQDLESLQLGVAPFRATLHAMVGEAYGQIRGSDFIYDAQGRKVVAANGLYLASDVRSLGSILPDYNWGWRNNLRYKDFTLSALVDVQKGGKYFSVTNMFGHYTGVLEETAVNGIREDGLIADGVSGTVTRNADGSYVVADPIANTTLVSAENYFSGYYSGPAAQNVFAADYIKLRELVFSYTIPKKYAGPLSSVILSAFARNLATWGLDNRHIDPEQSATGSGNVQGLEGGSLPASRSYGLNIRIQF